MVYIPVVGFKINNSENEAFLKGRPEGEKAQGVYSLTRSIILNKKRVSPNGLTPLYNIVPRAGLEPARICGPRDFKSLASTNSATQAVSRTHEMNDES